MELGGADHRGREARGSVPAVEGSVGCQWRGARGSMSVVDGGGLEASRLSLLPREGDEGMVKNTKKPLHCRSYRSYAPEQ
jgi:hypothetical protein